MLEGCCCNEYLEMLADCRNDELYRIRFILIRAVEAYREVQTLLGSPWWYAHIPGLGTDLSQGQYGASAETNLSHQDHCEDRG